MEHYKNKWLSPKRTVDNGTQGGIFSNEIYLVTKVDMKNGHETLRMLTIINPNDNRGYSYYWSDYFYTLEESRKLKINNFLNRSPGIDRTG